MAEKYVTVLPRWNNEEIWLFRVLRETPQRLYVEPAGENPSYFSPAKGRSNNPYIERHQAIVLSDPGNIGRMRRAWTERCRAHVAANDACKEAKAAANATFEEAIKGL